MRERHRDRRLGDARRTRRASGRAASIIRWWRRPRRRSPARPIATWARSAAISASIRAASIYNQSEWWRDANNHCLKTTGTMCHVAPKSRGVCFATFSGDLAPAFLTLGRRSRSRRPGGQAHRAARMRSISALRGRTCRSPRRRATASSISRCGRARSSPPCARRTRRACARPMTRSASAARSNIRWPASRWRCVARATRSPICASPSPAPIRARCCSTGTAELCGGPLDDSVLKGLDDLVRDQVMAMKTTFTPGHYRRRVAGVLARRLVVKLFAG